MVIVEEMHNDGKPQGKHFLSVFPVVKKMKGPSMTGLKVEYVVHCGL